MLYDDLMSATVQSITKTGGIAGQVRLTAAVQYPGEDTSTVSFVGSVYGGPVVYISSDGHQTFVTDPSRFGTFGPEWVRRFFDA